MSVPLTGDSFILCCLIRFFYPWFSLIIYGIDILLTFLLFLIISGSSRLPLASNLGLLEFECLLSKFKERDAFLSLPLGLRLLMYYLLSGWEPIRLISFLRLSFKAYNSLLSSFDASLRRKSSAPLMISLGDFCFKIFELS